MPPLTVPATLDALSEIGRYLEEASRSAGLSKQQAYNLRLAVDEIATNIVVHGYQEHGLSGAVVVSAESTADGITLTLEDESPEFNPLTRKHPTEDDLTTPLDERAIGGLGIFLAIKSVDEFRYERRGTTNVNTFVVRREPKA